MNKFKTAAIIFTCSCLFGCSVGKDLEDAVSIDPSESQLTILLSGNTKFRSDEAITLTYSLEGSLASTASVSYDGPTQLALDLTTQTISGDSLAPGQYDVTVTATADQTSAVESLELESDANFAGRYSASVDTPSFLTMSQSAVGETDQNGNVLTRTANVYWFTQQTNDTAFVDRLCAGSLNISGSAATGGGYCKLESAGAPDVADVPNISIAYNDTGDLTLNYSSASDVDEIALGFSGVGEAYISPDVDFSGAYKSPLVEGLDFLKLAPDSIDSVVLDSDISRCAITAVIDPYTQDVISATQADGSIVPVSQVNIGNCDLTDQAGYAISVGDATGDGQRGIIVIFESGISDNTLSFDLYAVRGLEYPDPISKLRYVRVCFEGSPTSIATEYDVTEEICEILDPQ